MYSSRTKGAAMPWDHDEEIARLKAELTVKDAALREALEIAEHGGHFSVAVRERMWAALAGC
jgi:hypothetical protein